MSSSISEECEKQLKHAETRFSDNSEKEIEKRNTSGSPTSYVTLKDLVSKSAPEVTTSVPCNQFTVGETDSESDEWSKEERFSLKPVLSEDPLLSQPLVNPLIKTQPDKKDPHWATDLKPVLVDDDSVVSFDQPRLSNSMKLGNSELKKNGPRTDPQQETIFDQPKLVSYMSKECMTLLLEDDSCHGENVSAAQDIPKKNISQNQYHPEQKLCAKSKSVLENTVDPQVGLKQA